MQYRPEVDGLRAVAVTSVVAYHVGAPGFGGGFVGVDVFFVISGYLITGLLVTELRERGSIDLVAFYARRARRLLPAFFLVVAATLLLGSFFLVPLGGEQQSLARSVVAAALYLANMHFAWNTGGYFDAPSELMPMLHTWSLAVEEQFYLVWPLLLILCAWSAARWRTKLSPVILTVLALVLLASLACGWFAAERGGRAAHVAFFILPSRAWELAIGALLALASTRRLEAMPRFVGVVLSWAGLLAIAVSVAVFAEGMAFPGIAALLPTLGALGVIAGAQVAPKSLPSRFLSSPPMVAVGLLSYSWYLWHWPLLAIARAHELSVENIWRDGALAIVALGLAWATYVWVESPIRRRQVWGGWGNVRVLATAGAASLILVAGGLTLDVGAEAASRNSRYAQLVETAEDKGWSRARCFHAEKTQYETLRSRRACLQPPDANRYVVVWGDSHADHITPMVEKAAAFHHLGVLPRGMGFCPPVLDVRIFVDGILREACSQFNAAVLAEIGEAAREGKLAGVILSGRWTHYIGRRGPRRGGVPQFLVARLGEKPFSSTAHHALAHGLKVTMGALAELGVKVVVIAPMPEQPFHAPFCLARRSVEFCSVERGVADERRSLALETVTQAVKGAPDARLWDPRLALCLDRCLVERDSVVLYRDDNHLSPNGARWLASSFKEEAAWLADAPRPELIKGRGSAATGPQGSASSP